MASSRAVIFESLAPFVDAWLSPPAPFHAAAPPSLTTVVAAAEAIDRRMLALDPGELVALAEDLRAGGVRAKMSWRWRELSPRDAKRILEGQARIGLASLVTLHRNGYVRQAGLEALATLDAPPALWAFALRLDDIVPALRDRARSEIERRLLPRNAAEIVSILPLVRVLSKRARAGASASLRAIEGFLVDPAGGRAALAQATRSAAPDLRLAASMLVVKRARLDGDALGDLLAACLEDADRRLARWAAIEVTSARVSDAIRERLLPRLDEDRDPSIRRRALLARARSRDSAAFLEQALFDPRARVRRVAREKLQDGRSRQLYRAALSSDGGSTRRMLGALGGLGEVGLAEDAALVVRWTARGAPRLQAEAIRSLGLLSADEHRALFDAYRASPYAGVRREAERALARIDRTSSAPPRRGSKV